LPLDSCGNSGDSPSAAAAESSVGGAKSVTSSIGARN
jgi:hypothetical protein